MAGRLVHLRPNAVYNVGRTRTYCGKTLGGMPASMSDAVVTFIGDGFREIDATVHGTLVTCSRCLPGTYRPDPIELTQE